MNPFRFDVERETCTTIPRYGDDLPVPDQPNRPPRGLSTATGTESHRSRMVATEIPVRLGMLQLWYVVWASGRG